MSEYVDYAGWELSFFDEAINFRNYQISIIKKYINGSVAEIGPGNGSLCEKYHSFCDSIILFEPSKKISKGLTKKFTLNPKIQVLDSTFYSSKKKFDCILLMDVLEHIDNPEHLIKQLYESLDIGGKLLINVPAFEHLYSKFDKDVGHFKRYNKASFIKETTLILPTSIKMFYYDSIGYFLSLLSQISFFFSKNYSNDYKKNLQKKIAIWNFLIPTSRVIDKFLFNTFGKSLFIVITK